MNRLLRLMCLVLLRSFCGLYAMDSLEKKTNKSEELEYIMVQTLDDKEVAIERSIFSKMQTLVAAIDDTEEDFTINDMPYIQVSSDTLAILQKLYAPNFHTPKKEHDYLKQLINEKYLDNIYELAYAATYLNIRSLSTALMAVVQKKLEQYFCNQKSEDYLKLLKKKLNPDWHENSSIDELEIWKAMDGDHNYNSMAQKLFLAGFFGQKPLLSSLKGWIVGQGVLTDTGAVLTKEYNNGYLLQPNEPAKLWCEGLRGADNFRWNACAPDNFMLVAADVINTYSSFQDTSENFHSQPFMNLDVSGERSFFTPDGAKVIVYDNNNNFNIYDLRKKIKIGAFQENSNMRLLPWFSFGNDYCAIIHKGALAFTDHNGKVETFNPKNIFGVLSFISLKTNSLASSFPLPINPSPYLIKAFRLNKSGSFAVLNVADQGFKVMDVNWGEVSCSLSHINIGETSTYRPFLLDIGEHKVVISTSTKQFKEVQVHSIVKEPSNNMNKMVTLPTQQQVDKVQMSPDEKLLFTACANSGDIDIWDLKSGILINTLSNEAHVNSIVISPNGNCLAASGPSRVCVWPLRISSELAKKIKLLSLEQKALLKAVLFVHQNPNKSAILERAYTKKLFDSLPNNIRKPLHKRLAEIEKKRLEEIKKKK